MNLKTLWQVKEAGVRGCALHASVSVTLWERQSCLSAVGWVFPGAVPRKAKRKEVLAGGGGGETVPDPDCGGRLVSARVLKPLDLGAHSTSAWSVLKCVRKEDASNEVCFFFQHITQCGTHRYYSDQLDAYS